MAEHKTEKTERKVVEKETVTTFPEIKVPKVLTPFQGFIDFMREQGVVGLAIGLVIGTQIKSLVDSIVINIINPFIGLMLPGSGSLAEQTFIVNLNGKVARFGWGLVVTQLISFIAVAAIVYYSVKALKLDKLDKKKSS